MQRRGPRRWGVGARCAASHQRRARTCFLTRMVSSVSAVEWTLPLSFMDSRVYAAPEALDSVRCRDWKPSGEQTANPPATVDSSSALFLNMAMRSLKDALCSGAIFGVFACSAMVNVGQRPRVEVCLCEIFCKEQKRGVSVLLDTPPTPSFPRGARVGHRSVVLTRTAPASTRRLARSHRGGTAINRCGSPWADRALLDTAGRQPRASRRACRPAPLAGPRYHAANTRARASRGCPHLSGGARCPVCCLAVRLAVSGRASGFIDIRRI